jgi:hypothetical protein
MNTRVPLTLQLLVVQDQKGNLYHLPIGLRPPTILVDLKEELLLTSKLKLFFYSYKQLLTHDQTKCLHVMQLNTNKFVLKKKKPTKILFIAFCFLSYTDIYYTSLTSYEL